MLLKTKYRLVMAEDHGILRDALRSILESRPEYDLVGEATDGREAIRCTNELQPDLLLLDLSMPRTNGLDALKEIKRINERTRVLILTADRSEASVFAAIAAGADGYVLKDAGSAELLAAIKTVLEGGQFLSPAVTAMVLSNLRRSKGSMAAPSPFDDLTDREREVLKLVAEGFRTRDIAGYLCISSKTVEKHRAKLMKHLELRTVAALTAYAIKRGLVSG